MRFRLYNHLYALFNRYFWLPCPLCGKYFGGHEWKSGNDIYHGNGSGEGVCPDCGEKAKAINKANYPNEYNIYS